MSGTFCTTVFTPLDRTSSPFSCTPDGNLTRRRRRQSIDTKPPRALEFRRGKTPSPRSQEPSIVCPSVALYYKFWLRKPADGLGEDAHLCLADHKKRYEGQNATYEHHGAFILTERVLRVLTLRFLLVWLVAHDGFCILYHGTPRGFEDTTSIHQDGSILSLRSVDGFHFYVYRPERGRDTRCPKDEPQVVPWSVPPQIPLATNRC